MKMNIHYKITLILIAILAVILSGIFFYLNKNLREDTYRRIKVTIEKEIQLAKTYLEEIPAFKQTYELDKIADKIGSDLGLRTTIIALDGTVFGDSELDGQALIKLENHLHRPEVQQALKSGVGESKRFSTTVKKHMLYVASLFGKNRPWGIIRLSMPLSEIELISDRLRNTLIFSFLSAFIIAIIISLFISSLVSKPLKKMSVLAGEIARGDFSKQIRILSNDEIGDLAKAFNYMSEEIRLKIQELNLSRSRLEAVLLSMLEGVMVVEKNGSIILMNQALKLLLHIEEIPLGKKPIETARNVEIQEAADVLLTGKSTFEKRQITVFGVEEKVLLLQAAPIIRGGRIEGAVLVFHDITDIKRLERMRRDFVANVSHELRTPITSIKGYAETLLNGALDDKENAKDFVQIIYSDADRLARLVEDILDLSKIESGRLKMDFRPCEVKALIKRVASGLAKQAESRAVSIKIDIPQDLPPVYADEARIAQVLLNLIDNAVKYNKEKGSVTISAKIKDKFIQIDVSDTGVGIPEKDLPRIFERFYRVDKARSRELGGTGLGLSIVKHIVSVHNGEVFVQSVEGKGSTFSFTIPAV